MATLKTGFDRFFYEYVKEMTKRGWRLSHVADKGEHRHNVFTGFVKPGVDGAIVLLMITEPDGRGGVIVTLEDVSSDNPGLRKGFGKYEGADAAGWTITKAVAYPPGRLNLDEYFGVGRDDQEA
jgi:hypothetical protein